MKRIVKALLLGLLLCLLAGCASPYASSYYHETDYSFPEQPEQDLSPREKVTVRDSSELRKELLNMVYAGRSEGRIAFDTGYEGDARADLEAACGTMHREDALWAYCVQNARFEISHIITHDEADVNIEYADSALPVDEILQMNYAAGLEKILRGAMESDSRRLVILIGNSSYSADTMADLVTRVYRGDPSCSAVMPEAEVYMYSGSGRQRLYDLQLDYGLSEEELQTRREAISDFDSEALLREDRSPAMRALALAEWLCENVELTAQKGCNTAWDAMIGGKADSEGLALAYVILCRQQEIPCKIVYGQQLWRNHCWNIIDLDGQHYHVDLSVCLEKSMGEGFLLNDESMWSEYRWDTSSYDICSGDLNYWRLTGLDLEQQTPQEPEETPEPTEEIEATDEPEPTDTPEPTEEPEPTESPEP